MKPGTRIGAGTLWQVVLRTFFLQTLWNFQRMQNVGFAFALEPVLRRLWPRPEDRARALNRHLDFFVTHPYCASLILGVVARIEEENAAAGGAAAEDANRIKVGMMGPLAALGDTLYWATLRPALALLGAALVLLTAPDRTWPGVLGPWVFLALFTAAHLSLRIGGVFAGHRRGLEVIRDLRRVNPQGIAQRIGLVTSALAGATAAGYLWVREPALTVSRGLDALILAGISAGCVFGLRKGFSASKLFYLMTAAALLVGLFGWV